MYSSNSSGSACRYTLANVGSRFSEHLHRDNYSRVESSLSVLSRAIDAKKKHSTYLVGLSDSYASSGHRTFNKEEKKIKEGKNTIRPTDCYESVRSLGIWVIRGGKRRKRKPDRRG